MLYNFKLSPLSGLIAISALTLIGCAAPQPQSHPQSQAQTQNQTQTQAQALASKQTRHYQDAPRGYADSEIKPNTHRVVSHDTQRYYQYDANGYPVTAPANRYALPAYGRLPQTHQNTKAQKSYYQRGIKYNASHPLVNSQSQTQYYRPASYQASAYRVQAGDTVYRLAKTYCSTVTDIARANGLKLDYAIQADDYLIIPKTRC